jgi:hypothetical protein
MRKFVYYGSFASAAYFTDLFGVPAAAYSLRKLSPNSVYAGAAIRVRRSSDNTEQDINFVSSAPNAGIDTAALLAFVGAGNGFVTTWYNQNGGVNHAVQTSAARQPRIVNGGVVELDNTKPALYFNGSQFLALSSTLSLQKIMSLFTLSNNNNKSIAVLVGSTSPTSNYNSDNLQHTINADGAFAQVSGFEYGQRIRSIHRNNSTTNEVYQNNTLYTITLTNNDFTIKEIGRRADLANFLWLGPMQELVFYSTNKVAERAAIETNINDYYNVF